MPVLYTLFIDYNIFRVKDTQLNGVPMTLLEELTSKHEDSFGKRNARILFLSQKDEIQTALEAGYFQTEVWGILHKKGQMPVQYSTFASYVRKYILYKKRNLSE